MTKETLKEETMRQLNDLQNNRFPDDEKITKINGWLNEYDLNIIGPKGFVKRVRSLIRG